MSGNWLDFYHSSNREVSTYIKGFLDMSGGNILLRNNNIILKSGSIYCSNDISLNKRLIVGASGFFCSDVSINGILYLNKGYTTTPSSDNSSNLIATTAFVQNQGYIKSTESSGGGSGSITASMILPGSYIQDLSLNKRLFVAGDSYMNGNLFISGKSIIGEDVSMNSHLFVGGDSSLNGNLYVSETTILNNKTIIGGDISLNNRLFVGGDSSLNGNLYVSSNTITNGDLSCNGKIQVNGTLSSNGGIQLKYNVLPNYDNTYTGYNLSIIPLSTNNITISNSIITNISNVGSLSLGIWLINFQFVIKSTGSNTISNINFDISTTNNTFSLGNQFTDSITLIDLSSINQKSYNGTRVISVNTSSTYYLNVFITYSGTNNQVYSSNTSTTFLTATRIG
jgi:cytoskeletal protein CcmA (bactofilin family)